jgi:lauroyl/myristoyl acyltransferase
MGVFAFKVRVGGGIKTFRRRPVANKNLQRAAPHTTDRARTRPAKRHYKSVLKKRK